MREMGRFLQSYFIYVVITKATFKHNCGWFQYFSAYRSGNTSQMKGASNPFFKENTLKKHTSTGNPGIQKHRELCGNVGSEKNGLLWVWEREKTWDRSASAWDDGRTLWYKATARLSWMSGTSLEARECSCGKIKPQTEDDAPFPKHTPITN